MVAGHLQEKKGMFYIALSFKGADDKRKTKWLPTGLAIKGNKKRAEAMLMEARKTFIPETAPTAAKINRDTLFSDFLTKWLAVVKLRADKEKTAQKKTAAKSQKQDLEV